LAEEANSQNNDANDKYEANAIVCPTEVVELEGEHWQFAHQEIRKQ
jgi:hypothetical protein